jgi:hypothetical protein
MNDKRFPLQKPERTQASFDGTRLHERTTAKKMGEGACVQGWRLSAKGLKRQQRSGDLRGLRS